VPVPAAAADNGHQFYHLPANLAHQQGAFAQLPAYHQQPAFTVQSVSL
jgi:hypothetical protein